MTRFAPLIDTRVLRPSQTALSLGLVSELELLRLKTLARWYARGLPPDVSWEDLLQEALTRILVGARRRPSNVPAVAFVAGVMKSLRTEQWRRALRSNGGRNRRTPARSTAAVRANQLPDNAPGPERSVLARVQLIMIYRLFEGDAQASTILQGIADGLTADEIRRRANMSETEYHSARKRMRRTLLREGLTCGSL